MMFSILSPLDLYRHSSGGLSIEQQHPPMQATYSVSALCLEVYTYTYTPKEIIESDRGIIIINFFLELIIIDKIFPITSAYHVMSTEALAKDDIIYTLLCAVVKRNGCPEGQPYIFGKSTFFFPCQLLPRLL